MSIQSAAVLNHSLKSVSHFNLCNINCSRFFTNNFQKRKSSLAMLVSAKAAGIPIMVNSCNSNMGAAFIKAAVAEGFQILPKSFGSERSAGNIAEICGHEIKIHGPNSDRESVLASLYEEHPNMIVVDYTVPAAVNANADLYCKVGVPFVMGTTGGDRDRLYKTVVAFYGTMKIMAEASPGAFSGFSLHVKSPKGLKLSRSAISTFKEWRFPLSDEIEMIPDSKEELEMAGVPQGNLPHHIFRFNSSPSPGGESSESVMWNFNIHTSSYVAGTVEAIFFLSKKIQSKVDKRIYNTIDLLWEPKRTIR